MRRFTVVVVIVALVLAGSLWAVAGALAEGPSAAAPTAAGSVRVDFNNDGFADLAVGVPEEDVGSVVDGGAVNVLYGSPDGLTGAGSQFFTQDSPGVANSTEAYDNFGDTLAAGDFNHDGFADLAIGARLEDIGASIDAGAVHVLYGSPDGLTATGSQYFTQATPGIADSPEEEDWFGSALAANDFDHDGFADLAIGVNLENLGSIAVAGAVHVLYGSPSGLLATGSQLFTQDTPGVPSSAEFGDNFGATLTTGDFDHDGFADLAVGAMFEDVGGSINAGAVNVLYGSAGGLTGTGSQLFTQDTPGVANSAERDDNFGYTLAAGDFDHDGFADLAVAAFPEDVGGIEDAGAVHVLYGSASGLTATGSQYFTQNTLGVADSPEQFDFFGWALAAGDFDHDGFADLAIGVQEDFELILGAGGMVQVLYGSAGGLLATGSQLLTQDTPGVPGSVGSDGFGNALATADFDHDGIADLAVSAPYESIGDSANAGAVNVLYGSADGLTGSGSQLFTQDTPGVGSSAEFKDFFGWALVGSRTR
jgi:FG-GAP repeat